MAKVFIVEDDEALRRELGRLLQLEGFEVALCDGNGSEAEIAAAALGANPACIILDLMLPATDGHAVCREIRAQSRVPLIMLTASDRELDELVGLGLGADDFVTKPYSPATLVARIRAHIRRSAPGAQSLVVEHRGLSLDLAAGTAAYGGASTELTRNELRILGALMRSPGTVVTRADLMSELWESDEFIDDNTLTVNVNRLRSKLTSIGAPKDYIQTRRQMGYQV